MAARLTAINVEWEEGEGYYRQADNGFVVAYLGSLVS
jgi:hypothetical protein